MDQQQQSRWRRIGRQLLWTIGVVVAVSTVVFVINRFFVHHPLWDWLKLLIVPAVLAGGGLWFNMQQRAREQQTEQNRARDEALQAYLDGMAELLTDKDQPLLRAQPGDSLRTVARARTLTVLGRLDGGRKRSVLQFLYESGLVYKEQTLLDASDLISRMPNIVSLLQADLREANLVGTILRWADLREAVLSEADLSGANLSGANLSGANLSGANLSGADLTRVDLAIADLSGADLSGATGWTETEQRLLFDTAASLEGATMPNGLEYEDWRKDR